MAKNSWETFGGTSSLNQLKGYIKSGKSFEYIANKTKLLNAGVTDPSQFVKEQFQRVFKKDNYALFKPIEEGGELYTKQNLTDKFGTSDIDDIKVIIENTNNKFYNFIKIE
ncbi:hypothetical protein V3Q90_15130 [Flavobacterium oreochromis]|uniref:hypothetical protein n=1 Tax=Flavobacterium oreochromis TaxID=2906078 RepID=UPI00385D85E3